MTRPTGDYLQHSLPQHPEPEQLHEPPEHVHVPPLWHPEQQLHPSPPN